VFGLVIYLLFIVGWLVFGVFCILWCNLRGDSWVCWVTWIVCYFCLIFGFDVYLGWVLLCFALPVLLVFKYL